VFVDQQYKRPKEIESKTEAISLSNCGTLHYTIGFDPDVKRPIEIRLVIGKGGVPCNILLDSWAKAMSMLLQSGYPVVKIVSKIKKQFVGVICTNEKISCINVVAERLLKELE
jgi:hypothetical protein